MKKLKSLSPENWVDQYGDALYHYAFKRVLDTSMAEDLVQETFVSALKAVSRFKGESTEKTWLFAILKNKIIDHYRKRKSSKVDHVNFSMPFTENGLMYKHWEKGRGPSDWAILDKDTLEAGDFMQIFKLCLSLLPPRLATVFALKVVEECESDEVCKEVGISSSNLWVMMHRARLQLRECLEKRWLKN